MSFIKQMKKMLMEVREKAEASQVPNIMENNPLDLQTNKMYGPSGMYGRSGYEEGGDIDAQMGSLMPQQEVPMKTPMEEPMVSDETMEDGYLDFILDEALEDEEETYLMEQLENNDRLSLIFDKVIDVATEFAGSGPVEGPGSGVSDSIPARLSDGEFVFTAKATEELGADNLEAIMKEAETQADGRQNVAYGGMIDEGGRPSGSDSNDRK